MTGGHKLSDANREIIEMRENKNVRKREGIPEKARVSKSMTFQAGRERNSSRGINELPLHTTGKTAIGGKKKTPRSFFFLLEPGYKDPKESDQFFEKATTTRVVLLGVVFNAPWTLGVRHGGVVYSYVSSFTSRCNSPDLPPPPLRLKKRLGVTSQPRNYCFPKHSPS